MTMFTRRTPDGYELSTDPKRLDLGYIHQVPGDVVSVAWEPTSGRRAGDRALVAIWALRAGRPPGRVRARRLRPRYNAYLALATADAHGLYEQFGFGPPGTPRIQTFSERWPEDLWTEQPDA